MPPLEISHVATAAGRIHIACAGEGYPVLLLHQTPRSWDEYRDVLPLLGQRFRVIAMDTPGFGASDALPPGQASIENWARVARALLDELGIAEAAVVGHHTGAVTAIEIAAAAPERVGALVLSACPFVDAERRAAQSNAHVIDDVEVKADGSHLLELWRGRQPLYPVGDTELLTRFMIDALRVGAMAAEGHRIVGRYPMEARIGKVSCPTLVLAPRLDPYAYPAASRIVNAIAGSVLREVEGAMVPFPDQMPDVFAGLVGDFIGDFVARDRAPR